MVEREENWSSSDENGENDPDNISNNGDTPSKTLGQRIQGRIASKMSSKVLAKQIVDGSTSDIIDNCYRIAKTYLENKKDAEKVMKNMIKIVVKVALLSRNNRFSKDELVYVEQFQRKFKAISKTIISFYEVDYSFDGDYIEKIIKDSQELLKKFVKNHLTGKSLNRIDHVYSLYSNPKLLADVFAPGSKYRPYLSGITNSLNTLIENGEI